MADLSRKVVVVTGASRGLGRGIAEGLAEAGALVYLTGRTASAAEPPAAGSVQAAARQVDALGGRGVALAMDHRHTPAVRGLVSRVLQEQGRIDVWVNHLRHGRVVAAALVLEHMTARGGGLLVDIAAPDGRTGPAARAPQTAADPSGDLARAGVAALSLWPAAGAVPRFTGRCVAALAMDPDILEKAGGVYRVAELVREYRFTDPGAGDGSAQAPS